MAGARKVLSMALITLILLSLINIIPMVVPASASPSPSDLEGWFYRRPIIITERSGNDLYNYSVLINVDFRDAILVRKARVDLADLRIVNSVGNELPFWIENYANTKMIYDYSANVGLARDLIVYAVVGDRIYGHNADPKPSRIWVYYLGNGTLEVLYSDVDYRFTTWQAIYNETEGRIYAVGQYVTASANRSAVFVIDVNTNSVSYVTHPNTGDVNEFIGVDEYKGYLFVGERNRAGSTTGSSYPNGGGVWKIPKDTWNDTSSWERIWEDPHGREIRAIRVYNDELYVLAVPGQGYGTNITLYRYNETTNTFDEVITFTDIDTSFDFAGFMDAGEYLYIAVCNSTTGTIHILAFNGIVIVEDFDTGVPNYHSVRILAKNIVDEDAIFLGTDRGDIYLVVWSSKRVLKLGEIPMKHTIPEGSSRATFNRYAYDPSTLTLYPTQLYDSCGIYSVEFGNIKVWVKLSELSAYSQTMIYVYYDNPSAEPANYTARDVFLWYDDFEDGVLDPAYIVYGGAVASEANGVLTLQADTDDFPEGLYINTLETFIDHANPLAKPWIRVEVKARTLETVAGNDQWGVYVYWNDADNNVYVRYVDNDYKGIYGVWLTKRVGGEETHLGSVNGVSAGTGWYNFTVIVYLNGTIRGLISGEGQNFEVVGTQTDFTSGYIGLYVGWSSNEKFEYDYIIVRAYTDPEPAISIGLEEPVKIVKLPLETMYLVHEITYSPNSTQFSHSFTATNTSTAGYETSYSDIYGWRVYANPYQSGGTSYENDASLVSEVNIALPYSEVLVKNVTLLARTSGTGSFRQLWVKVLNSTGGVVAELVNATMGTSWIEISLVVNTSLSGQITIWINATVKSTTTVGEEIAVKDVRVYVEYKTNPQVTVSWSPNVEFFNCSASHYVELGSSEYLNSSVITFKLIQFMTYNTTDYPVQPSYVGNETIGSYNYSVYRIDTANYSQYMIINALLENRFKTFRTHAKGYDTETILIGEPLTVELPELGNITIVELNKTFINVTSVTISFSSTGTFTVEANLTQTPQWRLGYGRKVITVKYGAFSVRPVDVDSRAVDYEDVVLQLINKTDGSIVRELTGNKLFSLTGLWAGNYSMVIKFKDITIGVGDFELNITTDASIIDLQCAMKSLARDYRGFNRTVVHELDKQLVSVEDLSIKSPFSRMRILLNGTGPFKLYINYRGDLPTKVDVEGNVTGLKYYWDGDYLVIEGSLGSIGELNITDLYKVRLEIYDRLGNLMPSWMFAFINGIKYSGAIVEDYFYPEDYVVKLPATINGFEFYSFFDGFDENVRVVSINNSDITLRAWYRVPTSIEVRSYQVASLWWLPFVEQDSDRVKVYIEGYLRDYYGTSMPDRLITINVTDVDAGFTWSINVTTDATGYFRTPLLELVRGRTYRIDAVYSGDDIYVGSCSTIEVKPEELPTAPVVFEIPVNYLLAAVGIALIAIGIFAAIRAARHTIEGFHERSRRFVRRKR